MNCDLIGNSDLNLANKFRPTPKWPAIATSAARGALISAGGVSSGGGLLAFAWRM